MWLTWLIVGCGEVPEADPGLTVAEITHKIGERASDPAGWAEDVRAALIAADQHPDAPHVCQVLAIIEQESGYRADPEVPGLAAIARTALEERLSMFGPAADLGVDWLLSPVPAGSSESFAERIEHLLTERDLDLLFRDLLAHHSARIPKMVTEATELLAGGSIDRMNPVQTAGSMQVSVKWAQEHADGLGREEVRDALYTRAGGVNFGTARLFAHDAPYDDPSFRFADFNAGLYASRNAAFQLQLGTITGLTVRPDGDVLLYGEGGQPKARQDGQTMAALFAWRAQFAPDLTDRDLERDAKKEKAAAFEETDVWKGVRAAFRDKAGRAPKYAVIPEVALDSPKISRARTTAWFADSVRRRYEDCLDR